MKLNKKLLALMATLLTFGGLLGTVAQSRNFLQLFQIIDDVAIPQIGTPAATTLDTIFPKIGASLDQPLRLYASVTPNAVLNIASNRVLGGNTGFKTSGFGNDSLGTFSASTINYQSGATSGGTIQVSGGAFALPSCTVGQFRRHAFVYKSGTNLVDSLFSVQAASVGALVDPGTLFGTLDGLSMGYVDLECTNSLGQYKTAGSSTSVIENSVSSTPRIINFESRVGSLAFQNKGFVGITGGTVAGTTMTGNTIVVASNTVTTAASGNLSATNLNGALSELQSDIDTRALSTSGTLTTPIIDNGLYLNQEASVTTPASGKVAVYPKSDNRLYIVDSTGVETAVGSGSGSGGINYVANPDAESATTGWVTYADAAATTPVDGTGGSPSVTLTRNTSSPIRGNADFQYTKPASNVQGQGFSYAFTISTVDRSKKLSVSYDYNTSAANYTAGDLGVYVYDVTNSVVITPTAASVPKGVGTFTIAFDSTTSTSYRLIFHQATTVATGANSFFDNIQVGPGSVSQGAAISDWVSFTPTGTWTANTTYTGKYRRVGSLMEIRYDLTLSGAPTSTSLFLNLPTGFTLDLVALTASEQNSENMTLGIGNIRRSATATFPLWAGYNSSTSLRVKASNENGGGFSIASDVSQANPVTFGSGDFLTLTAHVPIAEWSGNGTVNLGQGAQGENVSNSSASDSDDSTSFQSGPKQITGSLTADRTKRVRFSSPKQLDEDVVVYVSEDGINYLRAPALSTNFVELYHNQNTVNYGVRVSPVTGSLTDFDITFARYRFANGVTFGAAGANWSTSIYWFAKKVKASSPVGFGLASATDSGLISATSQTLAGDKTFTGANIFGATGGAAAQTLNGTTTINPVGGSGTFFSVSGNNPLVANLRAASNVFTHFQMGANGADSAGLRTSGGGELSFYTGTVGTGAKTAEVTSAGAWTLGVANSNSTHLVNGANLVFGKNSGSTTLSLNTSEPTLLVNVSSGAEGYMRARGSDVLFGTSTNHPLSFRANGIGYGQLAANGEWTLGTTSASNVTHGIINNSITNHPLQVTNYSSSTSSDSLPGIRILKGSTTTTTSQVFLQFYTSGGSQSNGQINANGVNNAAFGSFSDSRLKENIQDLDGELSKILSLRPVEFDYKNVPNVVSPGHQIGFIAQEIQEVYPDSVSPTRAADGEDYLSLSGWDKTTARIVKAIQELKGLFDSVVESIESHLSTHDSQIAALQSQVSDLQAANAILMQRLDALEASQQPH